MPRMHDATRQAHRSPSSRDPAPSGDPHKQRQKQLPHGCHPPRKITHKSALCCFALVVLATGCTAAPADTLILSPLGRHEVPVGSTWLLELQTKGAIGAVAFERCSVGSQTSSTSRRARQGASAPQVPNTTSKSARKTQVETEPLRAASSVLYRRNSAAVRRPHPLGEWRAKGSAVELYAPRPYPARRWPSLSSRCRDRREQPRRSGMPLCSSR
jgi:hypothetical protein